MKARYLVAAAVVGALCTVVVVSSVSAAKRPTFAGALFANATGKKEVSATTGEKGAGDTNARVGFTAVIDGTQFCWSIAAKNVDGTPSGAHIHRGGPSTNGPIVIPLDPPEDADPGASSGCETITTSLAREIGKNASRFYFNLHSTPGFPGGAARGQLSWKKN
jgi:CHRD domain